MNFLTENMAPLLNNLNLNSNSIGRCLLEFIKNRNGWLVQSGPNNLSFQYFTQIDQFERRKTIITFEQRKNSYRFNFYSKINPNAILGGATTLKKKMQQFNKSALNQNSLYYFNQPNLFAVRSNVEKDSDLFENQYILLKSLLNLIETTSNQFKIFLIKLVKMSYQQYYNSSSIRQMSEVINISKIYFTEQIKKRNSTQRKVQYQYNINTIRNLNYQLVKQQNKDCTEQDVNKLNACFRRLKLQKSRDPSQVNVTKPLAFKIKMMKQNVDKNWKAPQSSYGTLQRVQAQYITLDSFNNATAALIKKQKNQAQNYYRNVLVRKNYKKYFSCGCTETYINPKCQCYIRLKSYNTEVNVVSFIRNVSSESVASYFLQQNQTLDQASKLYSQYYPNNLSIDKNKSKDLFDIILNILQALKTFQMAGIIHRDLKPNNILLDSKKVPKIIDFGSAWVLNKAFQQTSQINKQLYTTKKYNLYFEEALFGEKHKMTVDEFEQHPLYDMHAFGVIIRELFSDSKISSELGSFILMNLSWLCSKCTSHNPNLRFTPQQASNFCTLLTKFWSLKLGQAAK